MSKLDNNKSRKDQADDQVGELLKAAGPRPAPPEHTARRIRSAVHGEWQAGLRRRRSRRRTTYAAAAAGLILLLAGTWAVRMSGLIPGQATEIAIVESVTGGAFGPGIAISAGQVLDEGAQLTTGQTVVALELTSGSLVFVDSQTSMRLDSGDRLLLEYGRIFVNAGEQAEPVVVSTPMGDVTDIGTEFEVTTSPGSLGVRVREGMVQVTAGSEKAILEQGLAASLEQGGLILIQHDSPEGESWNWLSRFTDSPPANPSVSALLDWYAVRNGLVIVYSSPQLQADARRVRVSGDLADLPREQLLEIALSATTFRSIRRGDRLVVSRRVTPAAGE